jgi:hypothetical protein
MHLHLQSFDVLDEGWCWYFELLMTFSYKDAIVNEEDVAELKSGSLGCGRLSN